MDIRDKETEETLLKPWFGQEQQHKSICGSSSAKCIKGLHNKIIEIYRNLTSTDFVFIESTVAIMRLIVSTLLNCSILVNNIGCNSEIFN